MHTLADTRRMPLATAAAVYEANGADRDFIGEWLTRTGNRQSASYLEDYRAAAETIVANGFAALDVTEALERTLTAATDRVRRSTLPGIPRAALDSLAGIYTALTAPEYSLSEPVPVHLIRAMEDACESYGVITGDERTTCAVHDRRAADCCA